MKIHRLRYFILGSLFVTGPAIWGIIWLYKRVVKKDVDEPYYDLMQCCWYVYGESVSITLYVKISLKFV